MRACQSATVASVGRVLRLGLVGGAPRRLELGQARLAASAFSSPTQPLAPRLGLRLALVDAARLGGEDLDLLLHRRRPRRAARRCASAPRAAPLRCAARRSACAASSAAIASALRSAASIVAAEPRVLGPRFGSRASRQPALCASRSARWRTQALAAFDDVADPLLEPAHLERGLAERALRRVQRVVGVVVRLADRLELGLGVAQVGAARLRARSIARDDRLADALFLARRVAVLAGTRAGAASAARRAAARDSDPRPRPASRASRGCR